MKRVFKLIICSILIYVFLIPNSIIAAANDTFFEIILGLSKGIEIKGNNALQNTLGDPELNSAEIRQALIETANAFLSHSKNIQYDQFRENRYATPEDATEQHKIYSVCSSFVLEIYKNTFISEPSMGYDSLQRLNLAKNYYETTNNHYIGGAADNVKSGKYILKYYETKEEIENLFLNQYSNIQDLINNWVQFLEPGDIFVVAYQYVPMGHTMMVLDVDKQNKKVTIIDNNGEVYDIGQHKEVYESEIVNDTEYGSIKKTDLREKLEGFIDINQRTSIINQLAFIRYINDNNKYLGTGGSELELPQVSDASISRMEYKGLYVEKTSRVIAPDNAQRGFYGANINDEIEYIIKIKNNSTSAYSNLKTREIIDENAELSSYNGWSYDSQSGELNKTINLAAGAEIQLKYTIRITNYNLIGEKIESTGYVADIKTPIITHYIGKALSKTQQDTLKQAYNNLLSTSKYNEGAFVDEIYKSIDINNLNLWHITNNLDLIEYSNNEDELVNKTKVKDTSYKNLFFANLYGLEIGDSDDSNLQVISAQTAWRKTNNSGNENEEREEKLKDENNRARTFLKEMLDVGDVISLYENNTKKVYMYLDDKLIRKYGSYSEEQYEEITGDELDTFLRDIIGKNYIVLRPAYAKTIENIEVTTNPSKTTYIKGEELNISGGKITATYEDGTTGDITITNNMVSGYNSNSLGEQTITVTYEGKSTTFKVTVTNEVTGIAMKSTPTKTTYIKGENLDLTGGKITATYEDGTTKEVTITNDMVSGYNSATLGQQTITVTYEGKTTTFKVTVTNNVTGIAMKSNPSKTTYIKGESLVLTGGKITATYQDGTTKEVTITNDMVSGYNSNNLGQQTITVTYEGKTTTFKVRIVPYNETMENIIRTYDEAKENHGIQHTMIFANNKDFEQSYENTKNPPNSQYAASFNWVKKHAKFLIENAEGYELTTELNQTTIREMLNRVEHLGYMYHYYSLRIKDETVSENEKQQERVSMQKCLERAWEELEVACGAETWYIKEFLNTAELTHVVALGYDWFYDGLTDEQRSYLKTNIINKGLLAYCDYEMTQNWRRNIWNWNPVCNGGISTGAMLFIDDDKTEIDKSKITSEKMEELLGDFDKITVRDLCVAIIAQSVSEAETLIGIPKWIETLNPKGANQRQDENDVDYIPGTGYLESTGYWIYAMKYFGRFISSLENTFDSTFNILDNKWIIENLTYPISVVSNSSNKCFNYGDGGDGGIANCEHLWIANKFARDANYRKYAQAAYYFADNYDFTYYTSGLLYYNTNNAKELELSEEELKQTLGINNDFVLRGSKQIGVLRENFTKNANIYASMIAGDNICIGYNGIDGNGHGDTDIGSYIFDAMGIRWIEDFGAEDYSLYDYFKIKTFRWNYYKKRAEAHSTLVINPQTNLLTDVNGKKYVNADQYIYADCSFINSKSKLNAGFLVLDMSDAYNREQNSIENSNKNNNRIVRGMKITDNRKIVIVQDEIQLEEEGEIYSFINIAKGVNIQLSDDKKTAVLTKDDKKVLIKINDNGNANIKFEIMPKKSILTFLNEESNSPDYGEKNSFRANLKNENENKLVIHLTNTKTEIINYAIIPVFEDEDENKEVPQICRINDWGNTIGVAKIEMKSLPSKVTYIKGENLDLAEGTITATYQDGTTKDVTITNSMVSGYNSNNLGEQTITVTYEGKTTTFSVNIEPIIRSEKYIISSSFDKVSGINPNTTVSDFLRNTTIGVDTYEVRNPKGEKVIGEALIGTGAKLKINNNEEITLVVRGDTNGDGLLDVMDLAKVVFHLIDKEMLTGVYEEAANIDGKDGLDIVDLSNMVLVIVDKMSL